MREKQHSPRQKQSEKERQVEKDEAKYFDPEKPIESTPFLAPQLHSYDEHAVGVRK